MIADAFLQQILMRPADYSVIATLNLNGDYIRMRLQLKSVVLVLRLVQTLVVRFKFMKQLTVLRLNMRVKIK